MEWNFGNDNCCKKRGTFVEWITRIRTIEEEEEREHDQGESVDRLPGTEHVHTDMAFQIDVRMIHLQQGEEGEGEDEERGHESQDESMKVEEFLPPVSRILTLSRQRTFGSWCG